MSRKTIRKSGVAHRRDTTKNAQTLPNKHKWTSRKTRQDEQGDITKRTTNTRQAGQLRLHSTSIKTTQNKNKNQAGKAKTCKQTEFDEGPHPPPIRRSPAPLRAHAMTALRLYTLNPVNPLPLHPHAPTPLHPHALTPLPHTFTTSYPLHPHTFTPLHLYAFTPSYLYTSMPSHRHAFTPPRCYTSAPHSSPRPSLPTHTFPTPTTATPPC